MNLFDLGLFQFTWLDALDVGIVAWVLFVLQSRLRRGLWYQVLLLSLGLILAGRVVELLNLALLGGIVHELLQIASLAVIIIYAPQIRRALRDITRNTLFSKLSTSFGSGFITEAEGEQLVQAVDELARLRTGALIVLLGSNDLEEVVRSGDELNAELSQRLLISIFNKQSPLHDGAVVVRNNRLLAARCVLPISDDPDLPPELGLRHRSALGISEVSDAVAIAVSEETGKVAVAEGGRLKRNVSPDELRQFLRDFSQPEN